MLAPAMNAQPLATPSRITTDSVLGAMVIAKLDKIIFVVVMAMMIKVGVQACSRA